MAQFIFYDFMITSRLNYFRSVNVKLFYNTILLYSKSILKTSEIFVKWVLSITRLKDLTFFSFPADLTWV